MDSRAVALGTYRLAWVTTDVRPAMVSVAVRSDLDLLSAAFMLTTPLPVPEVGLVIDSQFWSDAADHPQSGVVVIVTEPVPSVAAMVCEAGLIV